MPDFDPDRYQRFIFDRYQWNADNATLSLHYVLGSDQQADIQFIETIRFPEPQTIQADRQAALNNAFELLHWVAGVSYWKTACPDEWQFEQQPPDADQFAFLSELYQHGLAEFGFVNQLDVSDCLQQIKARGHWATASDKKSAHSLHLKKHCLAPIGGGKDSLVAVEMLKELGLAATATAVRPARLITEVAQQTGLSWLPIQRQIAPELIELNQQGAYNGHVPITAINACILLAAAIIYDFRWVVFANESSADEPTRRLGETVGINHQYSKSSVFEQALQRYTQCYIAADLQCFSLLRPMTELGICQRFADLSQYHSTFSSCNRQFHLDGARIAQRWCGQCPKCRFVFLALAPFIPAQQLQRIFGKNLLEDTDQIEAFADLTGLGEKPFECVGTIAESRAAMRMLKGRREWDSAIVVQALNERISDALDTDELLQPNAESIKRLPDQFQQVYSD